VFGVRISHFSVVEICGCPSSTFLVPSLIVFTLQVFRQPGVFRLDLCAYPDELNERIVNPRPVWKPEATSRTKLVKEKQFLLL
jgi:hypothetical protein